ncbi:MAG: HEAT repeat domain-containing protein [Coleofasciculaceae cyanobacterium]
MIYNETKPANCTKVQPIENTEMEKSLAVALEALAAGDFQERWEVAKLFSPLGKAAITPLVQLLQTEEADLELCWFVARILGEFDEPQAIAALVNLLTIAESEEIKAVAATTLANFGLQAIAPLSNLLRQPQWQLLAIQSLSQIRHSDIIEPLLTVVNSTQAAIRASALEALGNFRDCRIPPILVLALDDAAAEVRLEATRALGRNIDLLGELDLVGLLRQRLEDKDEDLAVREQAAVALSLCGTGAAVITLFQSLQACTTPVTLKLTLVRALSWIETSLALKYLERAAQIQSVPVFREIVLALGRVEQPKLKPTSAAILSKLVYSGHPAIQQSQIKQYVAVGLGKLGGEQAKLVLQELVTEGDAGVRLHANAALQRLHNQTE